MPLFPPSVPHIALYDGETASNSTGTTTANTIAFVPIRVTSPVTLTSIRTRFAVGGNGHYDLGIYDSSGTNGDPGNLLAHAASTNTSLATANTTIVNPAFVGGNLALSPGLYWLAYWVDNATDTVDKTATLQSGIAVVRSMSSTGPLPSTASSLSNGSLKPILIGLIVGGMA